MHLSTPLEGISGIGYTYSKRLERLNLFTVGDLINHFPFRYDDFSNVTSALETQVGQKVTLVGEIWSIKNTYTRSRKVLTQAIFNDGTSPIELVWFNQSYLIKNIKVGDRLQISGKISKYKNKYSIVAPVWERVGNATLEPQKGLHTGALVPVYPETSGISSKWLRTKIDFCLPLVKEEINDYLPDQIKGDFLGLSEAIEKIHFPKDTEDGIRARERLAFDELFLIQLATQKSRHEWKNKPLIKPLKINEKKLKDFIKSLPFELTKAQKRVVDEIINDLKKEQPMNRLVQGEVGSGKTVVAAIIIYLVLLNGYKALYMAPTEILAFQHQSTLNRLLNPYGITPAIYTGSKKFNKGKDKITQDPQVIVGTHAILSESLDLSDVGIVIVDEQQRFGVEQRSLIRSKAKLPHFLTMTATPIPRTVALTLYGDLDLSVIDELPRGRQKIQTHVVPSKKREDAYKFIEKKVKENGDQVYVITPLIELSETLASAKAAVYEFERLQKKIFPDLKLGLLHGRLKSKEKEQAINDFKDKKIDILVSTSVVEVGVDVSNATIMVIENAERFGLAQLHQLRGRVGRGEKQSYTLLFPGSEESSIVSRLKNLERIEDGLRLAELDLKIRGSGEIFGAKQSGRFELKLASFSDLTLIEKTRNAAAKLLNEDSELSQFPELKEKLATIVANASPD